MKAYPSILRQPKGKGDPRLLHVFDKIDGSNLRFEWARSDGWFRWGSRHRLLDESHPVFGGGMAMFREALAGPIERVARAQGWEALVAFAEFAGPKSLGGQHAPDDAKSLTLFDVAPYRRGLVGPERFLELFAGLPTPRYLGQHAWTDDFVARVRRGDLEGVTFEGVVGKAGDGHGLVMAKAKTGAWVARILEQYGDEEGKKLVDS
jgi:hypothetical protein